MLRFITAAAVSIFLSCATNAVAAAEKPTETPGAELHGDWMLQSTNGEKDKHADDANESSLITFDIEAGTWKLVPRSDDGGFTFFGTFIADPTPTPKILDAVIQGDGGNTDVFLAYKIEGDVLTLNLRKDGQRPADFEVAPDVSTVFVFKKVKAE